MLLALLIEILYKCLALSVTITIANYLCSEYVEALIEFTRAYITVVDLLYAEGRLPARI